MKKVLSLVLALALVLGSFAPVFAAENPYTEEGEILKDLGVFKGDQAGLRLDDQLKRSELFTLISRLMGEEEEAASFPIKGSAIFSDSEGHWSDPIIGWAYAKGLTKGYPDGTVKPENIATVQETQLFLLRALGYENVEWADVPDVAVVAGVMGDIEAEGNATRGLLAGLTVNTLLAETTDGTILALDLGYEELIVPVAVEVVEFGEVSNGSALELPEKVTVVYEDGSTQELAVVWDEYDTTVGGELVVEGTIEGTDLVAIATAMVGASDLEVESITADNLKQVIVKFNKDVSPATLVKENFVFSPSVNINDPVLADDNQTVTLTVASDGSLINQTQEYKITIKNVKDLDGNVIEKTVSEITPFDRELPKIEELVVTGPKSFNIIFSEPIKTNDPRSVVVKSENMHLSIRDANADNTSVVKVNLFTPLVDGKTYTVTIQGYEDFAGYGNIVEIVSLDYAENQTKPVATLEKATQQYVVIEFDRPVKGLEKSNFYHSFSAWQPVGIYGNADDMDSDTNEIDRNDTVSKVYVRFATDGDGEYPLQPGDVNVTVLGSVGTRTVKDAWGNAFDGATFVAEVDADKQPPTITEAKVLDKDSIKLTFDKAIGNANIAKNYEVLNSDGSSISGLTITPNVASNKKSVILKLNKDLTGETVVVNVKDLKDTTINTNEMESYTVTLNVEDAEFAGLARIEYDASEKVLYVVYNESMNETAINIENYRLNDNGVIRELTGFTTFFTGTEVVKIELSDEENGYVSVNTDSLLIANVQDAFGNSPSEFQLSKQIIALGSDAAKPDLVEAKYNPIKAVDANTVEIQFDQRLETIGTDEFGLKVGSEWRVPVSVETELNSHGTLVRLTYDFTGGIPSDLAGVEFRSVDSANVGVAKAFEDTKNSFGVTPKTITTVGTAIMVEDFIAPSVASLGDPAVDQIDVIAGTNGIVEYIVVEYDEVIDYTKLSSLTYSVTGRSIERVYTAVSEAAYGTAADADAKFVVIDLTTPGTLDPFTGSMEIVQELDIFDADGNVLSPTDEDDENIIYTAIDSLEPVTEFDTNESATNSNQILVVTFSEALYTGTNQGQSTSLRAIQHGEDVKSLFTYSGTAANYGTAVYNATDKTVTFTFDTAENLATIIYAGNSINDAGDNGYFTRTIATYDGITDNEWK